MSVKQEFDLFLLIRGNFFSFYCARKVKKYLIFISKKYIYILTVIVKEFSYIRDINNGNKMASFL